MPRRTFLDEIRRLDPQRDYQRIVFLGSFHEFPWDNLRSLEFALFRTFAVPSISQLLASTGEFEQRAQKRRDDTDLMLSEIVEHGIESERGRAALRRMNRIHGRFPISNEDNLYVLSTFVFEPLRWNERFGWRKMLEQERLAAFYFWRALGQHMNIQQIPETIEEFERFNREYERTHFRYSEANRRVGGATRDLFLSWYLPRPLWRLGAPFFYSIMDDALLEAFQFPRPSRAVRWLTRRALRLRAWFVRMLPERRKPWLHTQLKQRSYPDGYTIEQLGPPPYP
jgi:hypothetical protein